MRGTYRPKSVGCCTCNLSWHYPRPISLSLSPKNKGFTVPLSGALNSLGGKKKGVVLVLNWTIAIFLCCLNIALKSGTSLYPSKTKVSSSISLPIWTAILTCPAIYQRLPCPKRQRLPQSVRAMAGTLPQRVNPLPTKLLSLEGGLLNSAAKSSRKHSWMRRWEIFND